MDIEQANERLKAGRIGLQIQQRGNKLSLQGKFPPKPNSKKQSPHQQRLALDLYANPAGIHRAEAEAKKIAGAIACREFDWNDYIKAPDEAVLTAGSAIAQFEKDYFAIRGDSAKTRSTWETDYKPVLEKLDFNQPITSEALTEIILNTQANSKSRQRACMACSAIAQFISLDFDAKRYKGKYSAKQVEPREIPSDKTIIETYHSITNLKRKWTYGMLATYGLRNHELFHLDLESLTKPPGILKVLDGKTGARTVFPCYPEWWEEWKLWDIAMPQCTGKDNRTLGGRISNQFNKHKLGKPYNLRHAWAIRSMLFGMDISMAAAQMGHSVNLHCDLYHKWITDDQQMKAFEILMASQDRPTPPFSTNSNN